MHTPRKILLTIAILLATLITPASAAPAAAPPGAAARWCGDLLAGNAIIDVMGHSVMGGGWTTPLGQMLSTEGVQVQIWTGAAVGGSHVSRYLPGGPLYGHTLFTRHNPSLIVMGWDLNEYAAQVSPAVFKANYQTLINEVRRLTPTSSIMLVHSPWDIAKSLPIPQWPYADAINELADANDVLLLRMESAYDTADPHRLYSDGIHHTAAGVWVDAVMFNYALRAVCRRG